MGDCPTAAAAESPHLAITSSSICSNEGLMTRPRPFSLSVLDSPDLP